jgi:hypothetical protein
LHPHTHTSPQACGRAAKVADPPTERASPPNSGKGLGKNEDGMTEALKAKRKEDNTGVRATEHTPVLVVAATPPSTPRVSPLLAGLVCKSH